MTKKSPKPIHPGEILLKEFLEPLGVTQYRLSNDIHVPPRRISEIIHGKRSISVDTAARLTRYFNTSPQFWLNPQTKHNLEKLDDKLNQEITHIQPLPKLKGILKGMDTSISGKPDRDISIFT